MHKDLERILKQALLPADEPDDRLNQKIIEQVKEQKNMSNKKFKRYAVSAAAAVLVLGIGSISAVAAWKYLTPNQVLDRYEVFTEKFSDALLNGDALIVNETQSYGGYDVTLMAVASGEELVKYPRISNGSVISDQTYAIVAIAHSDGTPIPDTSEDAYGEYEFFVSPLIQGYNPVWYNAAAMHGGYSEFVEDGIIYRIAECDDVEIFADHMLYLCVLDSTFYNGAAYTFNEETGSITRNEDYAGLNALFHLPIDPSKADPAAAAEYVINFESEMNGTSSTESETSDDTVLPSVFAEDAAEVHAWCEQLTPENIEEYCDIVEESVQHLVMDGEGYIEMAPWEVRGTGSNGGRFLASWMFDDSDKVIAGYSTSGSLDTTVIQVYTKNDDGTVTFAIYIPKEPF